MKNIIKIWILIISIGVSGCNIGSVYNEEALKIEQAISKTSIDERYTIIDGCVYSMYKTDIPSLAVQNISNAVCVMVSRFVFCEDGTVIDLYSDVSEADIAIDLIAELNSTCGVRKIVWQEMSYDIFTNDGKIYTLDFPDSLVYRVPILGKKRIIKDIGEKVVCAVLNNDSTVTCTEYNGLNWISVAEFSECSEWTNVSDICIGNSFIIGLTKDGKVLSCGIDFTAENVVKIGVLDCNGESFPIALTANGTFFFPENHPMNSYKPVTEASKFTDIVDFITVPATGSEDCIILAQKSDGSLIATTNNIYNPEYVSQPE